VPILALITLISYLPLAVVSCYQSESVSANVETTHRQSVMYYLYICILCVSVCLCVCLCVTLNAYSLLARCCLSCINVRVFLDPSLVAG